MSKMEFMRELEGLLSDIPLEERNEAIKYYNDYFEDAGEDHEAEIIQELGSPKRIAGIIKADLSLSGEEHENRGFFTEKGYQDTIYTDEKYELIKTPQSANGENSKEASSDDRAGSRGQSDAGAGYKDGSGNGYTRNSQSGNHQAGNSQGYQGASGSGQYKNNTNIALLILLGIFLIPIGIPMVFAVFGVLFGFMAALFGIVIGFGTAGVAMTLAGAVLFIIGIVQINVPLALLMLCGSGLVIFGLGILFLLLSIQICRKLLPAIIRGIVNLCRIPFKNRSVMV